MHEIAATLNTALCRFIDKLSVSYISNRNTRQYSKPVYIRISILSGIIIPDHTIICMLASTRCPTVINRNTRSIAATVPITGSKYYTYTRWGFVNDNIFRYNIRYAVT